MCRLLALICWLLFSIHSSFYTICISPPLLHFSPHLNITFIVFGVLYYLQLYALTCARMMVPVQLQIPAPALVGGLGALAVKVCDSMHVFDKDSSSWMCLWMIELANESLLHRCSVLPVLCIWLYCVPDEARHRRNILHWLKKWLIGVLDCPKTIFCAINLACLVSFMNTIINCIYS